MEQVDFQPDEEDAMAMWSVDRRFFDIYSVDSIMQDDEMGDTSEPISNNQSTGIRLMENQAPPKTCFVKLYMIY